VALLTGHECYLPFRTASQGESSTPPVPMPQVSRTGALAPPAEKLRDREGGILRPLAGEESECCLDRCASSRGRWGDQFTRPEAARQCHNETAAWSSHRHLATPDRRLRRAR
jgi:hypothetical protein